MKKDILFEMTQEHLETGLRGIPVGYCTTSYVDAKKGLFYVGRPLREVSDWDPLQVIYLLFHKQEGSEDEVKEFSKQLASLSTCSEQTIQAIKKLPKSSHPMDLFCCGLQILGVFEKTNDYRKDCLSVIAKLPHLVASIINYHAGWDETPCDPEQSYMRNFTHMLGVPDCDKTTLWKVFRLFNILHYDHGGGNLSAFVGKAVASGLQHLYGSLSASMNALAGPRHGLANQDSLKFVEEVYAKIKNNPSERAVEEFLREKVSKKELIYGFGHAVLRVEDVRAGLFYEFSEKHFPDHPLVKTAFLLRKVCPKILKENPKISNPYPNIDAMSGTLLTAAGFHYPEYFTLLFGLSRCVGIAIQIVYERLEARDGKGTPIIRPKYLYKAAH